MCSDESWTKERLLDALTFAQNEGWMESFGSHPCVRYKFVHDRLQRSAYDLVEASEKAVLHWQVGWALYISPQKSEPDDFLAVEHLNRAVKLGAPNVLGVVKLAELNLETANKSKAKCALMPAAGFLRTAWELLETESPWEGHYDLILAVATSLVEIHVGLGDFDQAHELIDSAATKTRSCYDAFPLHMFEVTTLFIENKHIESFEYGAKALSDLGFKIPQRVSKPRLFVKILSVRRRKLKRMSNAQILSLPDMTDKRSIFIIEGMTKMIAPIYGSGNDDLMTFVCLQQIEIQLRYGLCSSFCFALFGYICMALSDANEAYRFGKLALVLHNRCMRDTSLSSFFLNFGFLHPLKKPLHECIEPLWSAYNLGKFDTSYSIPFFFVAYLTPNPSPMLKGFMTGNDPHFAGISGVNYANVSFHCGLYLPDLFRIFSDIVTEVSRYRQLVIEGMANVSRQRLATFIGKYDGDVMVLDGVAMNETSLIATGVTELRILQFIAFEKLVISVYFTKIWPAAAQEVFTTSNNEWKIRGFYLPWAIFISLTAMRLAKSHFHRRKNLHRARSVMKDYDASRKNGNGNTHVLLMLLEAEYLVVKGMATLNEVKTAFDIAIATAKRSGFVNIAGLGNVLAAEYLQASGGNLYVDYAEEAAELYRQWGASALVTHVERKFTLRTHHTRPDDCTSSEATSVVQSDSRSLHSSDFAQAHQGRMIVSSLLSAT